MQIAHQTDTLTPVNSTWLPDSTRSDSTKLNSTQWRLAPEESIAAQVSCETLICIKRKRLARCTWGFGRLLRCGHFGRNRRQVAVIREVVVVVVVAAITTFNKSAKWEKPFAPSETDSLEAEAIWSQIRSWSRRWGSWWWCKHWFGIQFELSARILFLFYQLEFKFTFSFNFLEWRQNWIEQQIAGWSLSIWMN